MIHLKRVYDEVVETDGYRVLIDRLWPRGVKKEKAHIDYWAKELTPSTELRQWYHQSLDDQAFARRYVKELEERPAAQMLLQELADRSHTETITFVYAAKDRINNHGVVLARLIVSQYQGEIELPTV